jgi:hypothetical protein
VSKRRVVTRSLLAVALVGVLALVFARHAVLRFAGGLLVTNHAPVPVDMAIMTGEAGIAGELEIADLFQGHLVTRVGALIGTPTWAALERARRGVPLVNPADDLALLGIPASAIVAIPADEGGTTEGMAALAHWCLDHQITRVLVVPSADHSERVRRALDRELRGRHVEVIVHTSRYDTFRAADWWQHRPSLRAGLVELEKLALDCLRHPIG